MSNLLANKKNKALKLIPYLIFPILVIGFLHSYWYQFYQPDDAFIYLVYVSSFLNGNGLTFNGELVEGYSSILWLFLVAFVSWLGVDPLLAAKGVGWMAYVTTGILLAWIHRCVGNNDRPAYIMTLVLYFLLPTLAMWAAGAMDAILFAALMLAASSSYFYARIINPSFAIAAFSGLLFGFISLTRPEGFALVGVILGFEMVLLLHGRIVCFKSVIVALGCYAVLTGSMFFGRWVIYGEWFPVTVSAKTGNLAWQMYMGSAYITRFIMSYPLIFVAYVMATFYMFFKKNRSTAQYFLVWMSLIVVSGYGLFNVLVGGDWMLGWRFLVPVLPFFALVIGLALGSIDYRVAIILVLIFASVLIPKSLDLNKVAYKETQATRGDILMGKYIKSLGLPAHEKIAVVDAGAIPYFSGLPTIDMIGLNDRHISKLPGGFFEKYDNKYVLSQKPKVIQFHTKHINYRKGVLPTPVFIGTILLFYTPEFQRWYEWDSNSPVPHLFIRRDQPLEHTFLDTYYETDMEAKLEFTGKIYVLLKKTGDGTWGAQGSNRLESGVVYLRVTAISDDGLVFYENHQPIPKDMNKGDSETIIFTMPSFESKNYRIAICPTLLGVRDFDICKDAGGYFLAVE